MMSVAIYGLQDDVLANKGKNVQLYIPGQTKLTAQDIFLGGQGTGVDDSQLNGATRVHGDTAEDTSYGLEQYLSNLENGVPIKTKDDRVSNSSPGVFGLQADVDANKGRNVNLYVPGKTQLSARDVFLGGTGTGVTDEQLNGAQRVFGNTTQDTANAYDEYSGDLSSQLGSAIAQNAAPRADAARGRPGLARQQMELNQAQNMVDNPLKISNATGKYLGKDTLEQKRYDELVRQSALDNDWKQKNFDYGMSKDTLDNQYKYDALAASQARSGGGGGSGSGGSSRSSGSTTLNHAVNFDNAKIAVDEQLQSGVAPGNIGASIESQRVALEKAGINIKSLIAYLYKDVVNPTEWANESKDY